MEFSVNTLCCNHLHCFTNYMEDNKVVFCTGGSGSICSAQVRAMVRLGANACIVGRNIDKVRRVAKDIEKARRGSSVIGIGAVDVRSADALQGAVDRCVKELGSIDFVIAGAAGNFLAPARSLSTNAFKSVIDIDILGSYNVAKIAMPHLIKAAAQNSNGTRNGEHDSHSFPKNVLLRKWILQVLRQVE
jgi:peroxisomal 2,4-dienoyl-CoA reductase